MYLVLVGIENFGLAEFLNRSRILSVLKVR